jgi:hypothetical protein
MMSKHFDLIIKTAFFTTLEQARKALECTNGHLAMEKAP